MRDVDDDTKRILAQPHDQVMRGRKCVLRRRSVGVLDTGEQFTKRRYSYESVRHRVRRAEDQGLLAGGTVACALR